MSFNRNSNNEELSTDETLREAEIDSYLGKRVGIYRLEKRIGKGGMGAVYSAMRDDGEFRQQVAVKLIKRGMDTDFVLNRFRHERQILASLEHPYIARLLDGGTTSDGLPYFVMDFIKGESLLDYADEKNLNLRGRLELFRRVCEAVEFAHQRKIVHRDLKPSNILVTSSGTPKLLDFGIAKLLNPEDALETLLPTQTQMRLMTAEYAAPEQIRVEEISPATDVYALGVMLYELISGERPYKFPSRAAHDVARVVCEENPLPLVIKSSLKTSDFPNSDEVLERVAFKCLEKNPIDRYQTVKEFSADIERFLNRKAVEAPKRVYRSNPKITLPTIAENLPTGSRSIAVLPLKILGATDTTDTGDQYLSFGLADALIARLSSVKRFVLRPTSSVLRYQAADVDSFTAGADLGVEFVVEGHLQKLGDVLRVSIQLLDVARHATVWAERFSEKAADVLELEDAISARVAESLIPQLTGEERERLEKRGTNSPEAYQAYLRGRYFYNNFNDGDLPRAIASYREAIRLDAEYALPYVGIADIFVWSAIFGEIPSSDAYPQAIAALHRALEIDSNSGEAYAMLSFTTLLHDWNRDEALRLARKALELSPNYGFAHECYSTVLATADLRDEAITEIKTAERLDPLATKPKLMTAWMLYQMRRFDESVEKADEATRMVENFSQGLVHLGNALVQIGEAKKATRLLEESYRISNGSALPGYLLCYALVADNRVDTARKILAEIYESAKTRYVKPFFIAMAHTALGEYEKALEYFERAVAERNEWVIWLGTDAKLDALRNDPRFQDLLRRTNNPLARSLSFESEKPATGGERAIAVLPLKLFGSPIGSDDEYLGIGLADALVTKLSNVRRFIVRPTSSVLPFDKSGANSFTAGRELGVDYVVDGSVRRAGERIRVSVQLLDVNGNSSRWAEQFDEHFTDVLELEDAISKRVAESLIPQLTDDERENLIRRGTSNAEAYEAYMRGRYFWNQFTAQALPKALRSFENAIALDPNYDLAYVGLAEFYIWAGIYGVISTVESIPAAQKAAQRALEINSESGEAYAILGLADCNLRNWAQSEDLYKKALLLNPNYPNTHEWFAALLVGTGNSGEGIKEMIRAEQLDPLSLRTKTLVAWILYQARQFDEAIEKARQILDLDKNYPQGYLQLGNALLEIGRVDEAVQTLEKGVEMMPDSDLPKYSLCFALVRANRRVEAENILRDLKETAKIRHVKPYFLAMAHAALNEREQAFEYFKQSIAENDGWILWFGTESKLDVLKNDERYLELLKQTNNPIIL